MSNDETTDLLSELALENERLIAKNQRLVVVAERLCDVTETFIREHSDPGTEALAAVHCARRELQNG